MKTFAKITLACFLIAVAGCGKYEDGPGFSLLPKTERLSNTWRVGLATENGKDITSHYTDINYTETYEADGFYSYASNNSTGAGRWEWSNDRKTVRRYAVDGQPTRVMYILRLKEKELWYYYMDGYDRIEFHMKDN